MTLGREIGEARQQIYLGKQLTEQVGINSQAQVEAEQQRMKQELEDTKFDRGYSHLMNLRNPYILNNPLYKDFKNISDWVDKNIIIRHPGSGWQIQPDNIFYLEWHGKGVYSGHQNRGLVITSHYDKPMLAEKDASKGFKTTEMELRLKMFGLKCDVALPMDVQLKVTDFLPINNKVTLDRTPASKLAQYTGNLVIDDFGGVDIALAKVVDLSLLNRVESWQERLKEAEVEVLRGGTATRKDYNEFNSQMASIQSSIKKYGDREITIASKAAQMVEEFKEGSKTY